MQENGIYRMPRQVRRVTSPKFQLYLCLDTFPISLKPPEAQKAQRYSCQGLNRIDKTFLLLLQQASIASSCTKNVWKAKHDLNKKKKIHYIQMHHKS